MGLLDILLYIQLFISMLAIFFNSFLISLVTRHSRSTLGFYKWIIVMFALFETTYSLVILLGMPSHFVAYGSWMVFNHGGLLSGTSFSFVGPALFCSFYEMWLGFLAMQFFYRYVNICQPQWSAKVGKSYFLRWVITLFVLVFAGLTLFCGLYLCTRMKLPEDIRAKVKEEFGVKAVEHEDYILLRIKDENGEKSIYGMVTISNHHVLVAISTVVILFCSIQIRKQIQKLRDMGTSLRRIKMQRQLLWSLLLQTCIPVLFCHLPSIIFLLFPFFDTSFSFGMYSLLITYLTSIEKIIDPLIVIFCIADYRRIVKKSFNFGLLSHDGSEIEQEPKA